MEATYATAGTPGRVNEDYAVCGPDWAVILDGATAPAGVDSGCIHDVPWLVRQLARGICGLMITDAVPLGDALAFAIEQTCQAHARTCDLANPDSPSSTVAIIRARHNALEYLVLGDSPVILRNRGTLTVIQDDRTGHLPGGRPYTLELVRSQRNQPGGFWVASTNPQAAYQAVTGTAEATEAALLTDGVTRLVDCYGYTWTGLFAILDDQGPGALISAVRAAEHRSPLPHGKQHDDATAVHARLGRWTAAPPEVSRTG
jgi:hypothetical protein